MARPEKYAWSVARVGFITGALRTLEDVSRAIGAPLSTVQDHSAKEDWFAERKRRDSGLLRQALDSMNDQDVDRLGLLFRTDAILALRLKELAGQYLQTAGVPIAKMSEALNALFISTKLAAPLYASARTAAQVEAGPGGQSVVNIQNAQLNQALQVNAGKAARADLKRAAAVLSILAQATKTKP